MANYNVNVTMRHEAPLGSGYGVHQDYRAVLVSMPLPLAVVCCVLNFVIPGLGKFNNCMHHIHVSFRGR